MPILRNAFRDALARTLAGKTELDASEIDQALSTPPQPELGDVAFPCFALAKALKKAPAKIAEELAPEVEVGGLIARVVATGPYLNVYGETGRVLRELLGELADGSFFDRAHAPVRERVMVEFSQPNTHKVFHVGHLRNVAVGDALQRVFRARGHDVVAANYYGDFGIDVSKCVWWLMNRVDEEPPAVGRCAWLGKSYVAATEEIERVKASGDEQALAALMGELKALLARMKEPGTPEAELYEKTRQWCLDEFAEIYGWLDVHFDHDFFESELDEPAQAIVDDFLEKGVFVESEGAIICDLSDEDLGAALVRKSDGTSLYLTWDLFLAQKKFDQFEVERSVYVVGAEQTYHFKQLFATLKRMGYERAARCRHVPYELVMLPDGKMSSRKGKVIPFHELRARTRESIDAKMREVGGADRSGWSSEQWDTTVDRIATACLKYGMLHVSNTNRVIFDLDQWTTLEGDTGAYLLYAMARTSGIFRKAGRPDPGALAEAAAAAEGFGEDAERALLNGLLAYPTVIEKVARTYDPSGLANWLLETTRSFNTFYHACPILTAEPAVRDARLALVYATEQVFGQGLRVLGIEPVEEM